MNIILIGSGHVASVLGRRMLEAGHSVSWLWSRNPEKGAALAGMLDARLLPPTFTVWPEKADLVLVSVSDNAYPSLARSLPPTSGLMVHTAGAVPGNIFASLSPRYGVLYPLQSIRAETAHLPELPLLIDASSPADLDLLRHFARSMSQLVSVANDAERLKYHLAAVFTANFANHLFALAENFCRTEQLDFRVLQPLLHETVSRMQTGSPAVLQTGPALRGDTATIEKHLLLLKNDPAMTVIYTLFTKSIMDFYS